LPSSSPCYNEHGKEVVSMSIVVKVSDLRERVKELRQDGVHLVELSIHDDGDDPFIAVTSADDPHEGVDYDDIDGVPAK
jgi:hypothetical protein